MKERLSNTKTRVNTKKYSNFIYTKNLVQNYKEVRIYVIIKKDSNFKITCDSC